MCAPLPGRLGPRRPRQARRPGPLSGPPDRAAGRPGGGLCAFQGDAIAGARPVVADEATGSPINPELSIVTRAVGNAAMLMAARIVPPAIALLTVFATANSLRRLGNVEFQAPFTHLA